MTAIDRLKHLLRRAWPSAPAPVASAAPVIFDRWDDQFESREHERRWLQERRATGRLYADLPDPVVQYLRRRWPERVERTRLAANRVCDHVFDLLGSGPRQVHDAARTSHADGYRPIDWASDPVAGLRFPVGFPHSQWRADMRPGMADIKWPWEIGRCQHWVALGQAFRLTSDERYAVELVRQHADFLDANPVGTGVQFVCTMDVAIRALNWALAFELIRSSLAFDDEVAARGYRSLFDLGVFIEGNLENKYEVTSNHFLSNVVGLYGMGLVFRDLPAGARWLRQGREWLEQEMRVQVLEDGADYESSIPYHRLVAELFLSGARLAQLEGTALSPAYLSRLRQMFDFLATVARPDGLMPQVGDADDGRLHIFTDYGTWRPQDGRHVLGPAAFIFNEPAWREAAGDDGAWEAAWWGANNQDAPGVASPSAVSRLFPYAGIAVVRNAEAYLLVTNGRVGTNGFGNHKHNDLLSFEYHAQGVPLVVDPGSYVYTSAPEARNLFRATAYHNTLRVDGIEQNELRLDYLFRMFETSSVEHLGFDDTPAHTEYRGRHTGYSRLTEPVSHERVFRLAKADGSLVITDRIGGSGRHLLQWHLHLAPGVEPRQLELGEFELVAGGRRWVLRTPRELASTIADGWYSPSYGRRELCRVLDFAATTDVAGGGVYEFTFRASPCAA